MSREAETGFNTVTLERGIFWLALLLVAAETLYGAYWAGIDVGLRLGIIPHSAAPDWAAILPTLTWMQEFVFFSHVVLNMLALAALALRWVGCLPLYIVSIIFDRLDWIILGMNPLTFTEIDWAEDMLVAFMHFGGLALMAMMLQRGELSARLNPIRPA